MACDTPYNVRNPRFTGVGSSERFIPVPCGKCPACLARRTSAWSFRLMQEDKVSSSAKFVTLTYDTDHVPITPKGYMTLDKSHVQDFMKRLRHYSPPLPAIKYYAAGEYGSQGMRPHYHLIMFNIDEEAVRKAWTFGQIDFGTVTGASVAYTAKYINKGKMIPVHSNDDRIPEFSLMSKGIGKSYMTPAVVAYHKADVSRNYVILDGGVKVSLPRYFREKIYDEDSRRMQSELIASEMSALETERYRRYVEEHGSGERYTKDRYESIKAKLANFRKSEKLKRNML